MSRTQINRKYYQLVADCDQKIKAGHINEVRVLLSELVISQIPRSARQGLAKCCRRVGLLRTGLRLLQPIIRDQNQMDEPATAAETCEYAALLSRNGSVHEALELLKNIDATKTPDAILYQAQCHIMNWDSPQAIERLEKFLSSKGDDYSKLIARVNLISCYIALSKLDQALDVLEKTIKLVSEAGALRLLANCYELFGQVYFWQAEYTKSRNVLNQAAKILKASQSNDQLLILKIEYIMAALEKQSVVPLEQFRKLAVQRKHWESVREADLFMLKVAPKQSQVDHLYLGTPKTEYRHRIEQLVELTPNDNFVLGSEKGPQLNLRTGLVSGADILPLGKKIHQVILALNEDLYVPISLGSLFHKLYPDEYFDVDSSPFRIRQAILRTRDWLTENNIPATIQQSQGAYKFLITGDFGIKLQKENQSVSPMMTRWQQLNEKISAGLPFTSEKICQQMGWSRTTFRRLADWGCANGNLQRFGTGKSTTYVIHHASKLKFKKGS